MDISNFYNVTSDVIKSAASTASTAGEVPSDNGFEMFLNAATSQINETNKYLHKEEEEEVKWALGLTDNTHELSIAQAKASTALQYTVALRDRFLDAYKEIMQIQI